MSTILNQIKIKPMPDRFILEWAHAHGISLSSKEQYCLKINKKDKLPRGLEKKLKYLRPKVNKILKNSFDLAK